MSKCSKIYGNLQQKPIELHRDSIHGILKTYVYKTFLALKPFMFDQHQKKVIAICLCKFYVHMRRAEDILVKQYDKQNLILTITNRLFIIKTIVQKQFKIHILISAVHQTKELFVIIKKVFG